MVETFEIDEDTDGLTAVTTGSPRRRRSFQCIWNLLSSCNSMAIVGLACAIAYLVLQLQYVSYRVRQEQNEIDHLKSQLQDEQQVQIEELTEQVDKQQSLTVYQMAGTFTILSCLITMFHMTSHLRSLHEPVVQRKIVTILWLSPIYSVTSFLSLVLPLLEGYMGIVKDFYEAYVVYTFLSFLISVLGRGNRQLVVDLLAKHADHLRSPYRVLRPLFKPAPETSDEAKAKAVLLECQILVMQFVLVKPLTSIANFLLLTLDNDIDQDGLPEDNHSSWSYFRSPFFYIAMINNLSVFLAFNGLLKFYHAVADDLKWINPFFKFVTIKGIVFLTFWQGLTIAIIVGLRASDDADSSDASDSRAQAAGIQNLLICLEMLFFSIAHWCVFPAEEWEESYTAREIAKPGLGIKDFASDVRVIMRRGQERISHAPQPLPQCDVDEEIGEEPLEKEVEDPLTNVAKTENDHREEGQQNEENQHALT